ncbi:MAG: thioredoxin domain-containing protein, partial [Gemmatimonadetes bacterium]|nr:thioredoxin domain-containing protein [Gemmatimonadota bacterium]
MHKWIAFAAFAALFFAPLRAALAADVPWNLVEGGEKLSKGHKAVVEEVLRTAKSYGACKGTILECLTTSPDDKTARMLANFAVRRAEANKDASEITESVENRRLSVYPPEVFEPVMDGLTASGNAKAPVKVLIYADFECPYCFVASTALRKISLEPSSSIAYYFKNFPLKSHEQSVPAALAFLAASKQGREWEMHDLMFENKDDLTHESFVAHAKKLGLDVAKFEADMKDKALVSRLRAEKIEGMGCGIKKSPGVLINGKPYLG